ncbi:MAG: hypothetical protein ACRD4R_06635 [Candidatus Acidiferrales bacterium]
MKTTFLIAALALAAILIAPARATAQSDRSALDGLVDDLDSYQTALRDAACKSQGDDVAAAFDRFARSEHARSEGIELRNLQTHVENARSSCISQLADEAGDGTDDDAVQQASDISSAESNADSDVEELLADWSN